MPFDNLQVELGKLLRFEEWRFDQPVLDLGSDLAEFTKVYERYNFERLEVLWTVRLKDVFLSAWGQHRF